MDRLFEGNTNSDSVVYKINSGIFVNNCVWCNCSESIYKMYSDSFLRPFTQAISSDSLVFGFKILTLDSADSKVSADS